MVYKIFGLNYNMELYIYIILYINHYILVWYTMYLDGTYIPTRIYQDWLLPHIPAEHSITHKWENSATRGDHLGIPCFSCFTS